MNKKDIKKWTTFKKGTGNTITHEEYMMVCDLHAQYFNHPVRLPCKCNPNKINNMIAQLNKMYDEIKADKKS